MHRSYRYRLNPTRAQDAKLRSWLELLRELYNAALQERRDAWTKQRVHVSAFDQSSALVEVKALRPDLAEMPIVVLRGAIRTLDKAFAGFFRRCKAGQTPGYPRFKGRDRIRSIVIDDLRKRSPVCAGGKRLAVPLLGKVRLKLHRPLGGIPKAMRITLDRDGKWYVSIQCADVLTRPLVPTGRDVGIDRKAVTILARKHMHVANVRREHAIQTARSLVAQYETIYVEALNLTGIARSMLSKSIHDAAWSTFTHWLSCKAEEAGREVVHVDPCGTSQICSDCGSDVPKKLAVRIHDCPHCGLVLDRDVNAARNVLRFGRSLRGGNAGSRRPMIREESQ